MKKPRKKPLRWNANYVKSTRRRGKKLVARTIDGREFSIADLADPKRNEKLAELDKAKADLRDFEQAVKNADAKPRELRPRAPEIKR